VSQRVNTLPAPAVVSQFYVTEAENEYVIRANSAIMKCKIPSFVSEFVHVDQWVADDGTIYTPGQEYGMRPVDVQGSFYVFSSFFPAFSFPHFTANEFSHFLLVRFMTAIGCSSRLLLSDPPVRYVARERIMSANARPARAVNVRGIERRRAPKPDLRGNVNLGGEGLTASQNFNCSLVHFERRVRRAG